MKKLRFFFWIYCAVMLWLLFGQRMGPWAVEDYWGQVRAQLNLVPFETLKRYFWVLEYSDQQGMVTHAFINLAGNVILFIPLGLCLPVLWPKLRKWIPFLLFTVGLILLVEVVQIFTLLGSGDVDDLILNVLGATVGFVILKLLELLRKKRGQTPK